jgi:GntR family transcriptional repressor for pyruvate dehydrogenase complex
MAFSQRSFAPAREQREEAYAVVANRLRAMILSGELAVGERLPRESELADAFAVSRSTIREALRVLGSQSLIEVVRGKGGGTFVAQPKMQDLTDGLAALFGLVAGSDECTIDELVDARKLLEVSAARDAATSGNAVALQALKDSLPRRGIKSLSAARAFESNLGFHVGVLRAAGNRVIEAVAVPVISTLHYRVRREPGEFPVCRTVEEHWELYERIASGDADRAAALMESHLEELRPVYSALQRQDEGGTQASP